MTPAWHGTDILARRIVDNGRVKKEVQKLKTGNPHKTMRRFTADEDAGYTESSLRKLLHSDLMLAAVKHFNAPRSSITLKQIAEVAAIKYSDSMRVSDSVRERQDDSIEYWEGLS